MAGVLAKSNKPFINTAGVPTREIAEAIGRKLGLPFVSKTPAEAAPHFGFMSHFFGMDTFASSELTQKELGWTPTHIGLLADIERSCT